MRAVHSRVFKALFVLSLTLAVVLGFLAGMPQQPPAQIAGLLWPPPQQLEQFEFADHRSSPFGIERLQNKWSLVFFGYTHCPDICPITLSVLDQVDELVSADADMHADLQVLFVTVDPRRDSPGQLDSYVSYFNERFIGLSADHQELARLTRQLGISYQLSGDLYSNDYLVEHSSAVLLLDPQRRLVGVFSAPHRAADIAERLSEIRRFVERKT